ncbi:MAG: polyketide synthase, partial [Chitinophaga rupis]
MASDKGYSGLEIAIIGISAQFPESRNYREFWQNLKEGKEMIKTFTDEELKKLGVPESALQNKQFVKSAAILSDKDCFDHGFFGSSVEEASFMDPQIRLFHQHCWMALEDAGYSSVIDTKKIGLFAGASINDNWKIYVSAKSANISIDPFFLKKIMSQHLISTLVSYKLNLRGPSIYVDTACSTSLSAVHLACRSLMTREAPLALAGGICIRTEKVKGYFYKEGMI